MTEARWMARPTGSHEIPFVCRTPSVRRNFAARVLLAALVSLWVSASPGVWGQVPAGQPAPLPTQPPVQAAPSDSLRPTQPTTTGTTAEGSVWIEIEVDSEGFSIKTPSNWVTIDLDPQTLEARMKRVAEANPSLKPWLGGTVPKLIAQGVKLLAVEVAPGVVNSGYATNLMVMSTPTASRASAMQVAQVSAAVAQQANKLAERPVVRPFATNAGEGATWSADATLVLPGTGKSIALRSTEVVVTTDTKAYMIQLSAPRDEADRSQALFDEMLRSFTVLKAPAGAASAAAAPAGEAPWKPYAISDSGLTLELPSPPKILGSGYEPVPPNDALFVGRVMVDDCQAGNLEFMVLVGFARAGYPREQEEAFLARAGRVFLDHYLPPRTDAASQPVYVRPPSTMGTLPASGGDAATWEFDWPAEGNPQHVKCAALASAGTVYMVAFTMPKGDAAVAGEADKALTSMRPEKAAQPPEGIVPARFLEERATPDLLSSTWSRQEVGKSGLSLSLPLPLEKGQTIASPTPAGGQVTPGFEVYAAEARGFAVRAEVVSLHVPAGQDGAVLSLLLGVTRHYLTTHGVKDTDIHTKAVNDHAIRLDVTAAQNGHTFHSCELLMARPGGGYTVSTYFNDGDAVAAQASERALASVRATR